METHEMTFEEFIAAVKACRAESNHSADYNAALDDVIAMYDDYVEVFKR